MTNSTLLVAHPKYGDLMYTGPLEPAQARVRENRTVHAHYAHGLFHVELSDCEEGCPNQVGCPKAAEWGTSTKSFEDAWRLVLGAFFGPVDEEYEGDESLLKWIGED